MNANTNANANANHEYKCKFETWVLKWKHELLQIINENWNGSHECYIQKCKQKCECKNNANENSNANQECECKNESWMVKQKQNPMQIINGNRNENHVC